MTKNPTRVSTQKAGRESSAHGSAGPADPHADPVTDPAMRRTDVEEPDDPTAPISGDPAVPGADDPAAPSSEPGPHAPAVTRTRTGGLWTGLILSALVLAFLLIFIVQNTEAVQITFLEFSGTLPTGVALLFAAIAGLLLVAIPGGLRILQLRRAARRNR